jgi:hypothetical protein
VTPASNDHELPSWFDDLATGSGSAARLDPELRKAMLSVTEEAAREQAVADARAREQQRADEARRAAGARAAAARARETDDRRRRAVERLEQLEQGWKITEVLWILFWIAVVLVIDATIINSFADPYTSDPNNPATRFGYNFFTCALTDLGLLVPALICRSIVYAARNRKRKKLQQEAST